ncbi:MAG: PaaI family thioesterase [Thermoguttaceae bacterium]
MDEETDGSGFQADERRRQMERMSADRFICDLIGIRLTEVGKGKATAELTLAPTHLNGLGICQGGVLFSIADYALAAAFNYAKEPVVSQDVSISYCKSTKSGKIIAKATETVRTRSTTLGDVVVTNEKGVVLAHVRGRGYILRAE